MSEETYGKKKNWFTRSTTIGWHNIRKVFYHKLLADSTGIPTLETRNMKYLKRKGFVDIYKIMMPEVMRIEREVWNPVTVKNDPSYGEKSDAFDARAARVQGYVKDGKFVLGNFTKHGPFKGASFSLYERRFYKYSTLQKKYFSEEEQEKMEKEEKADEDSRKEDDSPPTFFPGVFFDDAKIRLLPKGSSERMYNIWKNKKNSNDDGLVYAEMFEEDLAEQIVDDFLYEEIVKRKVTFPWLKSEEAQKLKERKLSDMVAKIKDKTLEFDVFKKAFSEIIKVKVAPELTITYPDGYQQIMRAYGFRYSDDYKKLFSRILKKAYKTYINYYINVDKRGREEASDKGKRNWIISQMQGQFLEGGEDIIKKTLVPALLSNDEEYKGFESAMRKYSNNAMSYFAAKPYAVDLNYFRNRNPSNDASYFKNHVYCKHSYRVITKPYYEKTEKGKIIGYYKKPRSPRDLGYEVDKEGDLTNEERAEFRNRLNKIKPVIKRESFEFGGENGDDLGLDEYGMRLEVEEISTSEWIPRGARVLSDIYKRQMVKMKEKRGNKDDAEKWRKTLPAEIRTIKDQQVYETCTDYIDISEIASYLENEWDAIRDDMRDGRYHKHSLTIYDYIVGWENENILSQMEGLSSSVKVKIKSIVNKKDNNLETYKIPYKKLMSGRFTQKEADMVRTYTMKSWNVEKKEMVPVYSGVRRSSNLNPCFDMRAIKNKNHINWMHAGRIFYYDTTAQIDCDILPTDLDPHVTTRGLAMFMLEYIENNEKFIADIKRIQDLLAKECEGLDYGPRHYAQNPTLTPSEIDLGRLDIK